MNTADAIEKYVRESVGCSCPPDRGMGRAPHVPGCSMDRPAPPEDGQDQARRTIKSAGYLADTYRSRFHACTVPADSPEHRPPADCPGCRSWAQVGK